MNFIDGTVAAANDGYAVRTKGGEAFPVPAGVARQDLGSEVVLGIRPEHVEISTGPIEATVVVTEPTGAETLVALHGAGREVLAMPKESLDVAIDGRLRIGVPEERIHLFDRESGARLVQQEDL
jgi:multiple sugar transport system ATP-binding protein